MQNPPPEVQVTGLHPFVPSGPRFAESIAFFGELGFVLEWQHEGIAALRFGGAFFLLQDIDIPEWQKNQMHVLEVTDLDAYWKWLEAKDLPGRFTGVKVRPPSEFPWGREIHLIDPAGVCWHIHAAPPGG